MHLTIEEQGWRALFAPEDDELAFEHEDGRFLAFTRVTRVVDPKTGRDVPAPTDLAEWLPKHPALRPTQAVPISVGGANGTRVDASPTQSDTDIFWYPTGAMHTKPSSPVARLRCRRRGDAAHHRVRSADSVFRSGSHAARAAAREHRVRLGD